MNPWALLEWTLAVSLSVIVAVAVIGIIGFSARALLKKPTVKRTKKPVTPVVDKPVAAKKTTTIKK